MSKRVCFFAALKLRYVNLHYTNKQIIFIVVFVNIKPTIHNALSTAQFIK